MPDQVEALTPKYAIVKIADMDFKIDRLKERIEKLEKAQEQNLFIIETYKDMFARLYRATTRSDRV